MSANSKILSLRLPRALAASLLAGLSLGAPSASAQNVSVQDNRGGNALLSRADQIRLDECIDRLLIGPGRKKIKIRGHEFNCEPMNDSWASIGNLYRFRGRLSHHLSFRKDDQVRFGFVVSPTGQVSKFEADIDRGGVLSTYGAVFPLTKMQDLVPPVRWTTDTYASVTGRVFDGDWQSVANMIMAGTMSRLAGSVEDASDRRLSSRGNSGGLYAWYVDIPGNDIQKIELTGGNATPAFCEAQCRANDSCSAWTLAKSRSSDLTANCWLKSSAPPASIRAPMVSGRVLRRRR